MLDSGFKPGPGQPCRTQPGASEASVFCPRVHGKDAFSFWLHLPVCAHALLHGSGLVCVMSRVISV